MHITTPTYDSPVFCPFQIYSAQNMAILTFEQKHHDFSKRPFNLSTQNLLCIEYGHLDLSRHDLRKALLFFPSKIYLVNCT